MPQYQLTEKGIKEARKRRTLAKAAGEAVTLGGMWRGEEYANNLLLALLLKPRKSRDVHELTIETFNKPRPSEAKISQTMDYLTGRGFVKTVEPARLGHGGFSDRGGQRLTRRHRRGFKRVRFT